MPKIERVNSELCKQIGYIINFKLRDPRIYGMLTVTEVRTSPDLGYAKVFVSYYGDDDKREETFKTLERCSGYIRKELRSLVKMRVIPMLTFIHDNGLEYASEMSKLIDKAKENMVYFEDEGDDNGND